MSNSTTNATPVSVATMFSAAELDLVSDAFAVLFYRAAGRRDEIIAFGLRHPELALFYSAEEPAPQEDR